MAYRHMRYGKQLPKNELPPKKTMMVYESMGGYVGKLNVVDVKSSSSTSPPPMVIIMDRSGSMGQQVARMINKIIPQVLTLLGYPDNFCPYLITFDSQSETLNYTIDQLRTLSISARGSTYMSGAIMKLEQFLSQLDSPKLRILTISDGDLHDQDLTLDKASILSQKIRKLIINSQAIRLFTSS